MQRQLRMAALVLVLAGCADEAMVGLGGEATERRSGDWLGPANNEAAVTVMTRNVYVGADIDPLLEASPAEIPLLVAGAFQELLATNFPERAEAFAREIAATNPHLIGLQEISLIQRQSPGDAAFGGTVPAEDVVFDFLTILMQTLEAYGLDYYVAAELQNFAVELPMLTGTNPLSFDDVRLTDYDIILARRDVAVSNVEARSFAVALQVPDGSGGIAFELPRGFTAVDATVGHTTVRFVNAHLEPASLAVQQAQASELIDALQDETLPVVLVGDLNTPAPDGPTYNMFLDALYLDAWDKRSNPGDDPGFTANHDGDLRNDIVHLEKRIDLVLVRNRPGGAPRSVLGSVFGIVVGDELQDRTPSGLWPSDHAGVVARMVIPDLGNATVVDR
jgi:hypothetical protein